MKISQAVDFHLSYHPRIESFFVEKKGIAKYEKMIKRLKYGPIIMHSHVHGIVCAVGTDSISVPQSPNPANCTGIDSTVNVFPFNPAL